MLPWCLPVRRKMAGAAELRLGVDVGDVPVVFRTRGGDYDGQRATVKLVDVVACSVASRRGEEMRPE